MGKQSDRRSPEKEEGSKFYDTNKEA